MGLQYRHYGVPGRRGGPAGRLHEPARAGDRRDLRDILHRAVLERLGDAAVLLGRQASAVHQDASGARITFAGSGEPSAVHDVVLGCDGVHSAVRRQFYPGEGAPHYTGVNMWRGVTVWDPVLSGASMVRSGWSRLPW